MRRLLKNRYQFHIVLYHSVAVIATVVAVVVCAQATRIDIALEQTASAEAPYATAVKNR
jgi:hypothetical protein